MKKQFKADKEKGRMNKQNSESACTKVFGMKEKKRLCDQFPKEEEDEKEEKARKRIKK